MGNPDSIIYLGRTNFRDDHRVFGIKRADRRAHMYVIGKTGTGKSTLLETMIQQDMAAGDGLALFDPHGDLVETILNTVPESRKADLIYLNAPDPNQPYGFNPVGNVATDKRPLAASGLLEVFKKIWADSWGPRMEHILRNAILALLDRPHSTLADMPRLFDDKAFRRSALFYCRNEQVRYFWLNEYEKYPARLKAEAIAPIQNKIGAFLANPILKRIVTEPRTKLNLRRILDGKQILLVNLTKGKIGEDTAGLLGALLVSRIALAALSRANQPEQERFDFYVYLDEFQNYTTLSMATMLSELRKYRTNLILAHQYMTQLDDRVRDAILGNAGTIICFRIGAEDADLMANEFAPYVRSEELVNLPNYNILVKLIVNGAVWRPFSGETVASNSFNFGQPS